MKLIIKIFILIVLCSHANAQVTNNYKKIVPAKKLSIEELNNAVKIDLNVQKGTPPTKKTLRKTIFDLTDKGQKALIESYEKKSKDLKTLTKAITEPLDKSSKKGSSFILEENYKIYTQLIFFVEDNWAKKEPSNRITSLKITLNIPKDCPVKIKGFKEYQTKYETIALGSIENTSTRNFSLNAGIGSSNSDTTNAFDSTGNQLSSSINGVTPSFSGTFGTSNSLKENLNLTRRIITQTGITSNNQMIIYLEGFAGRNLNGPITLELEFEPNNISKRRSSVVDFSIDKNKKGIFSPKFLFYPHIDSNIEATYSYEWLYRKIVRKGKSNIEGKHVISYYSHRLEDLKSKTPILKKQDANVKLYSIVFPVTENEDISDEDIYLLKGGESHQLNLRSFNNAVTFKWFALDNKGNVIDGFKLAYLKNGKYVILKQTDFKELKIVETNTIRKVVNSN